MHNISSLWFFWAISLGFEKPWFDGDDLPSHGTIRKKHKKKNKSQFLEVPPPQKKSHPTRGGGYNKWLEDFLSRCYRNWRLQPVLGPESPGKLSTKSDSKTIRVWDWIIKTFLWKKIEKYQKSQMNKIRFKPPKSLKIEMFKSLFWTTEIKKERCSYHFWAPFATFFEHIFNGIPVSKKNTLPRSRQSPPENSQSDTVRCCSWGNVPTQETLF